MTCGARAAGRPLALLLAAALCAWLTACAQGVPPTAGQRPSTHLTGAADSPLARAYTPPGGDTALSGVALLGDPLQALAAQPGVEVRLFNPFPNRDFKMLGYLTDFERLNRRMHDKSFTADNLATIVGGRNAGDTYFGGDAALLFSDLDLLALGPAARTTARLFDTYWNSPLASPLADVVDPAEPAELASHQQQLTTPGSTPEAARLLAGLQTTPWLASPLAAYPLTAWLRKSQRTLDLMSPYFVPGDAGVQALVDLARRGVAVRVVTNSLDPRSAYLNAEIGLTVDSAALARTLTGGIDRDLAATTYRLTLAADGGLQWEGAGAGGAVVHRSDPKASLLRRLGNLVLSWLPIEGLL